MPHAGRAQPPTRSWTSARPEVPLTVSSDDQHGWISGRCGPGRSVRPSNPEIMSCLQWLEEPFGSHPRDTVALHASDGASLVAASPIGRILPAFSIFGRSETAPIPGHDIGDLANQESGSGRLATLDA